MLREKLEVFHGFFTKILTRKNPEQIMATASKAGLEKTLTAIDLIILGVGAIIGSGIFAVVGIAAAGQAGSPGAGPALIVSMVIATVASIFSAMCYSEFSTMIPVAGGAYTYTFVTLGEFAAWIVGWLLTLEYLFGYIGVACSWSKYVMNFLDRFSLYLPTWLAKPPVWLLDNWGSVKETLEVTGGSVASVPHLFGMPICVNLPALLIVVMTTVMLVKGTKDSTKMAAVMVAIKLSVIALFVIFGAFCVRPENWTPFAPYGFKGICMGAFTIFFAYVGFDALATTAEECKNPQKDLPIGIIGSLIITTLVYISVALVLTGIYNTSGHVDAGFINAPLAFVMNLHHIKVIPELISIGAIAGLTSVLMVLHLATTRVLYAMSRDNFLPNVFQVLHPKFKTPHFLTVLVGVLCIVGTLMFDVQDAAHLCVYGTFASFIVICVAVLILRKIDPDRPRPFKCPCSPWFPLLGIICCGGLMIYSFKELKDSSMLFGGWIVLGIIIYALYGYAKNRKAEISSIEKEKVNEDKEYVIK